MEIMQERLIAARLRNDAPDVAIHVDTSDVKLFEFYHPAEIIHRGEEAARREMKIILEHWRRQRSAGKRGK
jgi:predicted acylesterase/phospholipase RssA